MIGHVTKDNERLARETAEKLRAVLFSVSGHDPGDYADLRAAVLAALEYDAETKAAFPSEARIRIAREKLESVVVDYVTDRGLDRPSSEDNDD